MAHYWNYGFAGWGWMLWFGGFILVVSIFGNWRYTYRVHRKYLDSSSRKNAIDLLNERYARGEISHEDFAQMRSGILNSMRPAFERSA
jgi:putative membrane protein